MGRPRRRIDFHVIARFRDYGAIPGAVYGSIDDARRGRDPLSVVLSVAPLFFSISSCVVFAARRGEEEAVFAEFNRADELSIYEQPIDLALL